MPDQDINLNLNAEIAGGSESASAEGATGVPYPSPPAFVPPPQAAWEQSYLQNLADTKDPLLPQLFNLKSDALTQRLDTAYTEFVARAQADFAATVPAYPGAELQLPSGPVETPSGAGSFGMGSFGPVTPGAQFTAGETFMPYGAPSVGQEFGPVIPGAESGYSYYGWNRGNAPPAQDDSEFVFQHLWGRKGVMREDDFADMDPGVRAASDSPPGVMGDPSDAGSSYRYRPWTAKAARARVREIREGIEDRYTSEDRFPDIGGRAFNDELQGSLAEEGLAPAALGFKGRFASGLLAYGGMNLAYGSMEAVEGVERAYQPALQGSAYLPDQAAEQAWSSMIPLATTALGAGVGALLGGAGAVPGAIVGGMVGSPIKTLADDYFGKGFDAERVGQAVGFGQGGQAEVEAFTQALKDATAATKDAGEALGRFALTGPVSPGFVNEYAQVQTYLGTATLPDYNQAGRALSADPMLEPYRAELAGGKLYGAGAQTAAELTFGAGDWAGGQALQAIAGAGSARYGGAAPSGIGKQTWEQFNEAGRATDIDAGDDLKRDVSGVALDKGALDIARLTGAGSVRLALLNGPAEDHDRAAAADIEREIGPLQQLRGRFAGDTAATRALDTQINTLEAQELPFQEDVAGRNRAVLDSAIGENGALFGLARTTALYSGASLESMGGMVENEAGALRRFASGPLVSPQAAAGLETRAADLMYQQQQGVNQERLQGTELGVGTAGVRVSQAEAGGTPDDIYRAQGQEIAALRTEAAELSRQMHESGQTVADYRREQEQLNQVNREGVELVASRRRSFHAAEEQGASDDLTAVTAGLSRQIAIGGSASVDWRGVEEKFGDLLTKDRAALKDAPPNSNEWKAANAKLASDTAASLEESDRLNIYDPGAQTHITGIMDERELRHADANFDIAMKAPWMDGTPESNPLTAGRGVEAAIGKDLAFTQSEIGGLNAFRQQRIAQGHWGVPAQEDYQQRLSGYTEQEDALREQRADIEEERMTGYLRILPEMVVGGQGVTSAVLPLAAMSAAFRPSTVTGGFGATPDAQIHSTLPGPVDGGAAGGFTQAALAAHSAAPPPGSGGLSQTAIEGFLSRMVTLLERIAGNATRPVVNTPTSAPIANGGAINQMLNNNYDPFRR